MAPRTRNTQESYADLEIALHKQGADNYSIDLRFSQPDSDADIRLSSDEPALVHIDRDHLRELAMQPEAYGNALSAQLFANAQVQAAFAQAISVAQTQDVPLRLRLFIGTGAVELHSVRWETLRDPQNGELLLTNENILFSRYLSSQDWRPVRVRSRSDLRALVVIANPSDLADYQSGGQSLPPFDVDAESERAHASMGDIPLTFISERGHVTINNISSHLREGYDILYLVAHGAFIQNEPYLWMEQDDGLAAVVRGSELVSRLRELSQLPRLVILASCQSAGQGNDGASSRNEALAALGPRLAEVGVPAVLAMQGNISTRTVERFAPVFLEELQRDGQIDRALAVARGTVRDAHDWWMPVLFMRLKSGRIWYVPGFGDDGQDFEKWPSLIRNIQRGNCTPILGPRLTETLPESSEQIALHWAETYCFPMAPHQREDLAQVAQYLMVSQDFQFPREEILEELRTRLLQYYRDDLPDDNAQDEPLETIFRHVGKLRRERFPNDPYKVLAEQPFSVYITTNFSNLLTEALHAAGKEPQVEICRWNADLETLPSIYDDDPDYLPTVERPLVYHLFGSSAEPDSLVITEDDYFDYLMGVSSNKDLIPIPVRRALTDTGLLILGFELFSWSFRVLFRSLLSQEGRGRRKRYAHVAGQINPEEGRILEPQRARQYMELYFQDADIDIFWGSVDDFLHTLVAQMQADDNGGSSRGRGERRRSRR